MEKSFSLIRKNNIWYGKLRVSNNLVIEIPHNNFQKLCQIFWKIAIEQDTCFLKNYLNIDGILL